MRVFIKNKLLWLLFGLFVFLNGCERERRGERRGDRDGFHDCPAARLSEEQQAQIREIHRNSRTSASDREHRNGERRASREGIQQRILNTVPRTEEQRTALDECFAQRQSRRY